MKNLMKFTGFCALLFVFAFTLGMFSGKQVTKAAYNMPQPNYVLRAKGCNMNAANTDVCTFTGLPPRYIVTGLIADNPSTTLTLVTVSLRDAASGGGNAIVNGQLLTTLTTTNNALPLTLGITNKVFTSSTLYVRVGVALGSAATSDFTLTVTALN